MQTKPKASRIPEFASREEEAEFWDTHDFTDYWDEFDIVDAKDVTVDKDLSTGITVWLTPSMLGQLRKRAEEMGIEPSTLARMWIAKQLKENDTETTKTT